MKQLLTLLLLGGLIAAWFFMLHPVEAGGRASYVLVSGSSMEPTFHTGDLVITRKQSSYQVGDVVTFRVDDAKVIHRIVGGNGTSGYILQGDNNNFRDQWRPTDSQVAGKQWLVIPGGAKYIEALRGPEILAGIFVFLFTVGIAAERKRRPRRVTGAVLYVARGGR